MGEIKNILTHWEYIFMAGLTLIIILLAALLYKLPYEIILVIFIIAVLCSIFLWTKKLEKRTLYLHNLFNLAAAASIGYLLSMFLLYSNDIIIGFIVGVVAMDVFSFTKKGGSTLNSKLMSQINILSRLSICLPIPQKQGMYPIIGIGDLTYYSFLTMVVMKACGTSSLLIILLIILIGQLLNIALIIAIKNKSWYKGFPATLMPGVLFILSVITKIIIL